MIISKQQLFAIMPKAPSSAVAFLEPIDVACREFSIDTEPRVECFMTQIAHESGQLKTLEEDLYYSADGLANTWPKRYAAKDAQGNYLRGPKNRYLPSALALSLHRRPEAIANNVYANRLGNGPESSGDGWRHRGAGAIQLTGRANHLEAATFFGMRLADFVAWIRTPLGAMRSAGYFWAKNGLNDLADSNEFKRLSVRVNGGEIGLPERLALWEIVKNIV